jgi:DNA-binding XRE family transcriptional regulator
MFYNLLEEMARHKPRITKLDVAKCLGVSDKTARNYLNGTSKISWFDVLKIKYTYFPELDIEYLFSTEVEK